MSDTVFITAVALLVFDTATTLINLGFLLVTIKLYTEILKIRELTKR